MRSGRLWTFPRRQTDDLTISFSCFKLKLAFATSSSLFTKQLWRLENKGLQTIGGSWSSGCFRHQRSAVRIQPSAVLFTINFIQNCIFFYLPIPASLIFSSIIQIEKSIDGVLGIQTQGCRMVGSDKTTELWQMPIQNCVKMTKIKKIIAKKELNFFYISNQITIHFQIKQNCRVEKCISDFRFFRKWAKPNFFSLFISSFQQVGNRKCVRHKFHRWLDSNHGRPA